MRQQFLVCLLASIYFFIFSATALAIGTAGFDISRPSELNPSKLVDDYFKFNLKPGQASSNEFVVQNITTDTTVTVYVYAADGEPNSTGGISFRNRAEPKKGLAKWIKLNHSYLTLAPKEKKVVNFRLELPAWMPKEEAFAGLVVEDAQPKKSKPNKQFVINIVQRAALLVIQRVPGPAVKALDIASFSRSWDKAKVVFHLKLKNKGNLSLKPKTKINIYTFGRYYDKIELNRQSLVFPKQVTTLNVLWPNTPSIGLYQAVSLVTYAKGKTVKKTLYLIIVPWWILLLLAGLFYLRFRKRQQEKKKTAKDNEKAEQEAEPEVVI